LRAALAAGARIFDIGEDPRRAERSEAYAAEIGILQDSGRVRVAQSQTPIAGKQTTVWEWVMPLRR
jgi:hypothetical protein